MNKIAFATLVLASPAVFAETGGYVSFGLNAAELEFENNDDERSEFDTGTGFNLTGGVRFSPGVDLRASFAQNKHDSVEVFLNGRSLGSSNVTFRFSELKLGAFYAPPQTSTVGFRVGGGYIRQSYDLDVSGVDTASTDGLFAEGDLLVDVGKLVTFDIGGTLFAAQHEDDGDAVGASLHAYALFHTGWVDIGIGVRGQTVDTDWDDGDATDEKLAEFRLTIGGSWGYPRRRVLKN